MPRSWLRPLMSTLEPGEGRADRDGRLSRKDAGQLDVAQAESLGGSSVEDLEHAEAGLVVEQRDGQD